MATELVDTSGKYANTRGFYATRMELATLKRRSGDVRFIVLDLSKGRGGDVSRDQRSKWIRNHNGSIIKALGSFNKCQYLEIRNLEKVPAETLFYNLPNSVKIASFDNVKMTIGCFGRPRRWIKGHRLEKLHLCNMRPEHVLPILQWWEAKAEDGVRLQLVLSNTADKFLVDHLDHRAPILDEYLPELAASPKLEALTLDEGIQLSVMAQRKLYQNVGSSTTIRKFIHAGAGNHYWRNFSHEVGEIEHAAKMLKDNKSLEVVHVFPGITKRGFEDALKVIKAAAESQAPVRELFLVHPRMGLQIQITEDSRKKLSLAFLKLAKERRTLTSVHPGCYVDETVQRHLDFNRDRARIGLPKLLHAEPNAISQAQLVEKLMDTSNLSVRFELLRSFPSQFLASMIQGCEEERRRKRRRMA